MEKSKNLSLIPVLPTGVVSNLEVTKDDLIAVAVSKKEQALLAQKDVAEKLASGLDKDVTAKKAEREKAMKAAVDAKWGAALKKANEALKVLGVGDEYVRICNVCYPDEDDDKKEIEIRTSLWKGTRHPSDLSMPIPAEVKALNAEVKALKVKRDAAYEDLCDVRKQLAQLPAMERQARAKWASAVIGQTAEGRKFLEGFAAE